MTTNALRAAAVKIITTWIYIPTQSRRIYVLPAYYPIVEDGEDKSRSYACGGDGVD